MAKRGHRMKKLTALVLAWACLLGLAGCSGGKQEKAATYGFHGAHEYFTVSDGAIVFNAEEEVFEGGDLEIVQPDLFVDVVSYSGTFYTMSNGEKHILLSMSVVDQTGGSVNINGGLGKIAGVDSISNKIERIDDLRENLWFELTTTDLSGKENAYQLQLTVTG